ncbi:hypothetical protein KAW43_00515 [Candidatus Parcubacteria bacterium]|nr:hypothetical protein [Candidatus Parcubacteria bacterium]
MAGNRMEVKDVRLRYRGCNGNNGGETKETKELTLSKAIITFDEEGIEREISIPIDEAVNVSDNMPESDIEVVSMIYMESKSI